MDFSKTQIREAKAMAEHTLLTFGEDTLELETDFAEILNFFNNKDRGGSKLGVGKGEGGKVSDATKSKNPYSAYEEVWEKPAKGEKGKAKDTLNSIKIDLRFYITDETNMDEFVKEKLVWLKLWEGEADKSKTPRFGGKEHKAECSKYGLTCDKSEVVETEGRKKGTWAFNLQRSLRKEAFGGGKTSYKSKYEKLLKWVQEGGFQEEGIEEYLAREETAKSRSPSPEAEAPTAPIDPEATQEIVETEPEPEPEPKKVNIGKYKMKKDKSKDKKAKKTPKSKAQVCAQCETEPCDC